MSGVRVTLTRFQAELLQLAAEDLDEDGETSIAAGSVDESLRDRAAWRSIAKRARSALDARPKVKR